MRQSWPEQQSYYDDQDGLHRSDGGLGHPPSAFSDIPSHMSQEFDPAPYHDDPYMMTSSSGRPLRSRRNILLAAGGILLVVIVIAIGVSAAGHGPGALAPLKRHHEKSGMEDPDQPVIGTTKNGPRPPKVEVSTEVVNDNRDEFGTTLVSLYDKYDLDWATLSIAESPQSKSLLSVTGAAAYEGMATAKKVQRYALGVFYYSTFMRAHAEWNDPTDWVSSHGWLTSADECEWEGIVCDSTTGKVTGILLSKHALSGYLPLELALLDQLQELDLASNFIHMTETEHHGLRVFGMLPKLVKLQMDDNYVMTEGTGLPSSFSKLTNLEHLSMSYNLLQGNVDGAVVSQMQKLTHLEIESNYLSGEIPVELGQLPNLFYLYLRRNSLTINLTELFVNQVGSYKEIFSLWLDDNVITGTIPPAIGRLTGLASLSITNSTLGGSIPSEIGNLFDLQRLWLYSNDLTGKLPDTLSSLVNLQVLEIYNNEITGKVPEAVCNAVQTADYDFRSMMVDCSLIECPVGTCCTEC